MSTEQDYCPEMPRKAIWEGRKYKLERSENFDQYMKALGVGAILRKAGNSISPTVELQKHENGWFSFITTSPYINTKINFQIGEHFEEKTIDGRKIKSICSIDEDSFLHEQKGQKPTSILREFFEDRMVATFIVDDVIATRIYKLVKEDEGEEDQEDEQEEEEEEE